MALVLLLIRVLELQYLVISLVRTPNDLSNTSDKLGSQITSML